MNELKQLQLKLRAFAKERDWEQFHSPKNLVMALSGEVGELIEHFQWLSEEQSRSLSGEQKVEISKELADVFIYLVKIADELEVDLYTVTHKKIKENANKYPVDKSRGSALKYNKL